MFLSKRDRKISRPRWATVCVLLLVLSVARSYSASAWVRPGISTNEPVWGIRGGLLWAVQPAGFRTNEPRGLIRLGYPILTNGGYDLINFLAVEPIVKGQKAFSELEFSELDKRPGKRIWSVDANNVSTNRDPGKLTTLSDGVEQLETRIHVEPFDNGAHVSLLISQRSDRPDEIKLAIHAETNSAPLEYCILTATMGNLERTRQLWLKDETVSSLKLYPNHKSDDFAPHSIYPLNRLARNAAGDVIVAITTDEADPAAVFPYPGKKRWHYGGEKVTQYWKKSEGTFRNDLHAAVNARYTYWKSQTPIPGGVAFENCELRERFYDGQEFVFGITCKSPQAIVGK